MSPKQALELLIYSLRYYAGCGRLKPEEVLAIKLLRRYMEEHE